MESKETAPVQAPNPTAGDASDMTTNFFHHLLSLGENALWHITIQIDNGYFIISTMLSETRGEPRPTILFKGTAQELDLEFFTALSAPIKETKELFANNSAYRARLEEARKGSQEKNEKDKAKPQAVPSAKPDNREEKRKKYDDAIKSITDLSSQWLYKEALELLPTIEEYPEKSADIEKLRKDLGWKSQQLFIK